MSSTHRTDLSPADCGGCACREFEMTPDGLCAGHGTGLERARQLRPEAGR